MKTNAPAKESSDFYRQRLVEKRRDVLSGMGTKFDSLARMGRVAEDDQAQISHDEFISLRVNSLDCAQLRLVDEALDRLRSGHYGTCLACEEAISAKRLRALPWARYCIRCQEEMGTELDRNWFEERRVATPWPAN
jgi:DnaK suppressor protein